MMMRSTKDNRWRFDRQLNLTMLVQLALLASLILGQWMDTQRRLDRVSYDVAKLSERVSRFGERLDGVSEKTIRHEVRLSTLETNGTGQRKIFGSEDRP
jgi:hypothetical protein